MHIIGIVGSMRKNCQTYTLVNQVINNLKLLIPEVQSEILYITDLKVQPCRVECSSFCSHNPFQCSLPDDVSYVLQKMVDANAVIIGTPLYFRAPPSKFHILIERLIALFYNYEENGQGIQASPVKDKPCGLVAVAQYSNPHQMLEYLHDFCTILKMKPIIIDRFPYLGVAGQGDVTKDALFRPSERSIALAHEIVKELK